MKALVCLIAFLVPLAASADVSVPRAKQYAWFNYDVSRDGGQSVSHAIGLALPAGALITNTWVYINTQFAASGSESLGISCVGSQDIMAYSSVKNTAADRLLSARVSGDTYVGAASLIPASPTVLNFSQGFGSVPAGCNVSIDVKSSSGFTPYTAGKLTGIIEYFRL